jgi:hypothetical protein
MSNSVNDAFKDRLRQARAEQEAEAVPMEFAGFPCRVIPLPLNVWMRSGRMPDFLTSKYLAAAEAGEDETAVNLTPEEALEATAFRRKAVCRVMVEPRIVEEGDPGEGGYLYADIAETAPAFVGSVFDWISLGCPLPEKGSEGKALGAEALSRFPTQKSRRKRARARAVGEDGRQKAVGANAADSI